MAREEILNWNLKFAEKPSHEPLGAPRTQSQLLRIINALAVSTEDPEDAPWRKGKIFSQPSSITKATIIYPFLPISREGKVRHRNKEARPRGRNGLRQYAYGEWLAEYRLLLLEKRNIQQMRQRRPEFAALEKWKGEKVAARVKKHLHKNVFGKERRHSEEEAENVY